MSYSAQEKEILASDARIESWHPNDCAPYMLQPEYALQPTEKDTARLQTIGRRQLRADIGDDLTTVLEDDTLHFPLREMD